MKWLVLSIVIMMAGAGTWALFLGASGIVNTVIFLRHATEKVPAIFVRYHAESVPLMHSVSQSNHRVSATNFFPVFKYNPGTNSSGVLLVTSDQKHLFKYYKPGENIEIWEPGSSHAKPRIAGFYSLFFLDLLTTVMGLLFIIIPVGLYVLFSPAIKTLEHEINTIQDGPVIVERPGIDNFDERADVADFMDGEETGKPRSGIKFIARLLHETGVNKYINFMLGFMAIIIVLSLLSGIPYFWKHFLFEFSPPGKFLKAIKTGDQKFIEEYLSRGWGINWRSQYEQNALLVALETKNYLLAEELIKKGSNVNIRSKFNFTPLDRAVMNNQTILVSLLLEKGARIDLCEQFPLLHVVRNRNLEVLKDMINNGADLSIKYDAQHGNKTTLLQFAVANKWDEGADLIEAARLGFNK